MSTASPRPLARKTATAALWRLTAGGVAQQPGCQRAGSRVEARHGRRPRLDAPAVLERARAAPALRRTSRHPGPLRPRARRALRPRRRRRALSPALCVRRGVDGADERGAVLAGVGYL